MFTRLNNVQKTRIFLRHMNCTLTTPKRGFCFKSPSHDDNNNLKKIIVDKPLVKTGKTILYHTTRAAMFTVVVIFGVGYFFMSVYSLAVLVSEGNPLPFVGTLFVFGFVGSCIG